MATQWIRVLSCGLITFLCLCANIESCLARTHSVKPHVSKREYIRKIEANIKRIYEAERCDVQPIVIETRNLMNEYLGKKGHELMTRTSFRNKIKQHQRRIYNAYLNGGPRCPTVSVMQKFRHEIADLMFPRDKPRHIHGLFQAHLPGEVRNVHGQLSVADEVRKDLGICAVGVGLMFFPQPTVQGFGGGLLGQSCTNIYNTVHNAFYDTNRPQPKDSAEYKEWLEGFYKQRSIPHDDFYRMGIDV